jgi:3-oxoacyl-(acyl-carrier-protein) synthase
VLSFEATRDGFVPGDAAGLIVMMRRDVADLLKIQPLAEVLGVVANTCLSEKYGKNLADGTITGQSALITRLLNRIGVDVNNFRGRLIHFLHGTGTKAGGINEICSTAHAVGKFAIDRRYVGTGIKEREGHSLGVATVANVIAAIEAMRNRIIPGLPNTTEIDPALREIDPRIMKKEGVEISPEALCAIADGILCRRHFEGFNPKEDIVIATSMGFGGANAAVALKLIT